MNTKRFIPAFIAVFVFIFLYEWFIHGVLLAPIYESTPELWRSKESMGAYFPWLTAGQFIFGFFFCLIFLKGYQGKGIREGLRYGLLIGLLVAPMNLIWYAVQPIPGILAGYWVVSGVVETVFAGFLIALIYRGPKMVKAT